MATLVVGITGGIGSGKSTVAKIFSVLGYPVYNSDELAKEIYFLPEVKNKIISLLGKEAYLSETVIDKKYIAAKIFSDTELLAKINAVIHPAVMNDFAVWKQKQNAAFILKESALLFETGLYKNCDKNILVTAPAEIRIQRVMARDKASHEEIENRIKNQLPDEKKIQLADFVIDNSGETLVIPEVIKIAEELKKLSQQ